MAVLTRFAKCVYPLLLLRNGTTAGLCYLEVGLIAIEKFPYWAVDL
jgi:hypothetical protein